MESVASRYVKPFTSISEQVDLLIGRGLQVSSRPDAEDALRKIGYYRLSGYLYPFRMSSSGRFRPGTSLRQILDLYDFDEALRGVLLEGIGQLEVALRFHVGHRLGRRGAFAHRQGSVLDPSAATWIAAPLQVRRSRHAEWLVGYDRQERRSQEAFVQHFRKRYGPRLPVWVATEVMSLGSLTELVALLPQNDRKLMAARFGVVTADRDGDSSAFSSWLNHLRHVRNLCAHHSRLWNRVFDAALQVPKSAAIPEFVHVDDRARRKIYGTLAVVRFLLARIQPESEWYSGALDLVTSFSRRSGVPLSAMGFPASWTNAALWAPRYEADLELCAVADAVESLAIHNQPEAMQELTSRESDAERKKWLRYLVRKQALIVHRIGAQSFYPAFQFAGGDVVRTVADANEALFTRATRLGGASRCAARIVQEWWLTPDAQNGFASSPLRHHADAPMDVLRAARTWSAQSLAIPDTA